MLILSLFTFYLRIAWLHLPQFFTRDLGNKFSGIDGNIYDDLSP